MNLDMNNIPKHVAIIMDGNGRWAKKRFLPRLAGHKAGVEALKEIVRTSSELGIQHLTVYAFSTENWGRPKEEIEGLFNLLKLYIDVELSNLNKEGARINVIGDITALPNDVIEKIQYAINTTKDNNKLQINIALNYGGRDEILRATKSIAEDVNSGVIHIDKIDDDFFASKLFTAGIPEPELLIRTSGELRLSNFLLWQLAYSEFYFTDVFWPDFRRNEFIKAIESYQNRNRRFGKL